MNATKALHAHTCTCTHTHAHSPSPQPPSSYCVAHKYSHPQDHSSLPWVGSSASCEEQQCGRGKQRGRRWGGGEYSWDTWVRPQTNQQQAAVWRWNRKWGEVNIKRGFIISPRVQPCSSWHVTSRVGCKDATSNECKHPGLPKMLHINALFRINWLKLNGISNRL